MVEKNLLFVDRPTPGLTQLGHRGAMLPERDRGASHIRRSGLDIAVVNSHEDPREIAEIVFDSHLVALPHKPPELVRPVSDV